MSPKPQLDHNQTGRPGADLLIKNATLLDPVAGISETSGDILVRNGDIAEIGAANTIDRPDGAEVIDADGLHAFPAFVDPHVHLRTPGREDEEDIDSGTRAAAAGGYCAIIAQPNTDPVVDSASILGSLRERARVEARIPTGFMAAVTRGQKGEQLTEMAELADVGAFGFTDDGLPIVSAGVMRQALQYQRITGRLIALHEEDPSLSAGGAMHEGAVSAALGIAGIPSISESTMIARDAAIAGYEDGRIHIQHVSARESVAAIELAKTAGVKISAEVSPHHLTLTDEIVRSLDANTKMNPPLRAESDRQALIEGLRNGAIDFIATDHAPHSREEKEQPLETAPFGIIGLETAFSVLYTKLVQPGVLPLELIVEKMSAGGPWFDIDLPSLSVGSRANITLVDLDAEWQVGEAGYESRSANSPWAGETLTSRVRMTVAAGYVCYRERSFAIGAVA